MFKKPYTVFEVTSGKKQGTEREMKPLGEYDSFTSAVMDITRMGISPINDTMRIRHEERNPMSLTVKEFCVVYAHPHGWLMTVSEFSITY